LTIGILGGGISGVSLAAHLESEFELLEKAPRVGGLCSSVVERGYTFDAAGPHIMFSKNSAVLALMVDALTGNVERRKRENRVWYKGRFVKYPFENGLGDLPKEDCFECILGYLRNEWTGEPTNLEEWSYATFGKGISEKYFLPYNAKIWNVPPAEITLEWVARIPKPPLEDVLKSAVGIPTEGYLHQLYFYYPLHGGYEALVQAFARRIAPGRVHTDCPVEEIRRDGSGWVVGSRLGDRRYDRLVSTLPIHELARVWPGFPGEARKALGRLRYNHLANVLLGISEDRGHPYTALYVPDPTILTHRISFPKAFSPHAAPQGKSGLMAEITCNRGDGVWELGDEELLRRTVADLEAMELLDPSTVEYSRVVRIEYGYPVYDHDYFDAVGRLRDAVRGTGLHLLGRFAQFDYINSDVCVERATALAAELNRAE
jgi:protoporphyrinogen oxidase